MTRVKLLVGVKKTMVLSSLRAFEQPVMDGLVNQYLERRGNFAA